MSGFGADLAPETPWDELITRSIRRGTSIRRRSLAMRIAPLVLAAAALGAEPAIVATSSRGPERRVTTVDDSERGPVRVDADDDRTGPSPRRTESQGNPTTERKTTVERPTPEASTGAHGPDAAPPTTTMPAGPPVPRPTKVAFVRGDPLLFTGDVYVMNADGSGERRVTTGSGRPSWSPDGRRLMFHRAQQDVPSGRIYTVDESGDDERFVHTGMYADWSPDGRRVVFSDGEAYDGTTLMNLFVADADGSNVRQLTNTSAGEYMATWSPDMSLIVYLRVEGSYAAAGVSSLWVIGSDGSNPRKLADIGYSATVVPSWTPDGARILYSCGNDLCIVGLDGSAPTPFGPSDLRFEYGVSWAIDGRTVFVQRDDENAYGGEKMQIWALDGDGANPRQLTSGGADDMDPAAWPRAGSP